jgi:capsular polysaccharide export protein
MQNLHLDDQAFRVGSRILRPLDSSEATSGLLRGPNFWSLETRAVSMFSADLCERLLASDNWCNAGLIERALAGIAALVEAEIGGNCWSEATDDPALSHPCVLVVAPTADNATLTRMIAAADSERGARRMALLAPSVLSGAAKNRLARLAADRGIILLNGSANAWSVLKNTSSLYIADGDIGFLALLRGIRVRCFGRPFYAGWGVTEDDPAIAPHPVSRSLVEIFAAACLLATDYTDPYTGAPSDFESICAILADWRRVNDANRKIAVCVGMSFWKRRRMRDVLRTTDRAPQFRKTTATAIDAAKRSGGAIAVWAAREPADLAASAVAAGIPIVRIEDGFVRSVGLGANFTPAASVVLDESGMYFDPTKPSDLESILENTTFSAAVIERSRRLIQTLVAHGITKYNTGTGMPPLELPDGRRRLFVPGQVENDRSVALGGAGIYLNIDLLRRVRALNPDAFIIYKPHPDVDAGHRPGAIPDGEVLGYADRVIRGVSTAAIIPAVDEIHTLTSLAGFEALIRKRKVVVYGQPFYSSWGLTTDVAPVERRRRRLSLEELIAGSLVKYPRYFDPVTRLPCGPEILIERLSHPDVWRPGALIMFRRIQGDLMRHVRNFRPTKTSNVSTSNLGKRRKHVNPA